jgi:thiol-disulfide isomerase/thioredoxin
MNKQKIVLNFIDGRIIKGYTGNFSPQDEFIPIEDELSAKQKFKITDLKAIFFVKTFEGNKNYSEKKSFAVTGQIGQKVLVRFKDSETLLGYLEGGVPWQKGFHLESKRGGFYLIPADDKSNNIKVFVVSTSVLDVTCF